MVYGTYHYSIHGVKLNHRSHHWGAHHLWLIPTPVVTLADKSGKDLLSTSTRPGDSTGWFLFDPKKKWIKKTGGTPMATGNLWDSLGIFIDDYMSLTWI